MLQPWSFSLPGECECKFLTEYAAKSTGGVGAAVLMGGGFGPAAKALRRGLAPAATLIVYDSWEWSSEHASLALTHGRNNSFVPRQSYLESFFAECSDCDAPIETRAVDPAEAPWSGGPIDLLVVDGATSCRAASNLLNQFIPALAPGRSILILRGILDSRSPWSAVLWRQIADCFELIEAVQEGTTAAFRCIRAVEQSAVCLDDLEVSSDFIDSALTGAAQIVSADPESMVAAKVALLLDVDQLEDAQTALEAVERGRSEVLSRMKARLAHRLRAVAERAAGDQASSEVALNAWLPPLRAQWRYRLKFRARSDHARFLFVNVNQDQAPYSSLGLSARCRLRPQWQEFSLEWECLADDPKPCARWRAGGDDSPLEIADVELQSVKGETLLRLGAADLPLVVRGDWSTTCEVKSGPPERVRLTLVHSRLLRTAPFMLGMTTDGERSAVLRYASSTYQGVGEIVDLGSWLGSTVVPFAQGLMRNHRQAAKSRKVHAFDRFIWEDWMNGTHPGRQLLGKFKSGESFLDEFLVRTAPWTRWIEPRPADLMETGWTGGPIEVLFVDAMKSWGLANTISRGFFPHVTPSIGYVFHQDYVHHTTPWIHLLMYRLRDCFEPVEYVDQSGTMIFRLIRPIDPQRVSKDLTIDSFSNQEIEEAFNYSQQWITESMRHVLLASMGSLFAQAGRFDEARAALKRARTMVNGSSSALNEVEVLIEERSAWTTVVHRAVGPVEVGKRYTASFTAKAERPRVVPVSIRQAQKPWDGLGLYRLLRLTAEPQTFNLEFTATNSDPEAVLQFGVGGSDVPFEARHLKFECVSDQVIKSTCGSGSWTVYPTNRESILSPAERDDLLQLSFR